MNPPSTHRETTMPDTVPDGLFKKCSMCGDIWHRRDEFVSDPNILFIGFQTGVEPYVSGYFLFNHLRCGTTLAAPLEGFADLSDEPIPAASCTAQGVEWEFCLARAANRPCPATCVCTYVHHISFVLHHWMKARMY